jgi:two-component system response regulator AtoC
MVIEKILIVDDEMLIRNFLAETLRRKQFDISTAENGSKALALLKDNAYDLVITDVKMPDYSGIDLLRKIKELYPQTIVIVITAFGSIENAVEAMRLGAFNYLLKPFSPDTIEALIEKACQYQALIEENSFLRHQASSEGKITGFKVIGESPSMKEILASLPRIAQSNANIFIHGESGTGKEVIAQAIHNLSPRADRPFIKVNCAAIPETLIESEFFGHEKGAFTGANIKRIGRFELADNGSLLLDEITEIPLGVQAKLLRAIQEQEFERIGGSKPIKVNVRFISTSNRDIKEAIVRKILREDLYYRLNVVPIYLPPLRERKDDILPLSEYFIERLCRENHKTIKKITLEAKKKLEAYSWPGNIRELANIIERTIVMDLSKDIAPDHLYIDTNENLATSPYHNHAEQNPQEILPIGITLQELEKRFIIETLHAQNNSRKKTAEKLGISIRTLRNKLNEYRLK